MSNRLYALYCGLGLELAIARQLTELHGGTIALANAGKGATFILQLPLTAQSQDGEG